MSVRLYMQIIWISMNMCCIVVYHINMYHGHYWPKKTKVVSLKPGFSFHDLCFIGMKFYLTKKPGYWELMTSPGLTTTNVNVHCHYFQQLLNIAGNQLMNSIDCCGGFPHLVDQGLACICQALYRWETHSYLMIWSTQKNTTCDFNAPNNTIWIQPNHLRKTWSSQYWGNYPIGPPR